MTFSRLPAAQRKTARLTFVMTVETMERLSRAAAYACLTKSECVHDLVVKALEGLPGVGDAEVVEAETRADDWRNKYGLR